MKDNWRFDFMKLLKHSSDVKLPVVSRPDNSIGERKSEVESCNDEFLNVSNVYLLIIS